LLDEPVLVRRAKIDHGGDSRWANLARVHVQITGIVWRKWTMPRGTAANSIPDRGGSGAGARAAGFEEARVDRILRTFMAAAAVVLLVAGAVQAARPVQGLPPGQAWADAGDGTSITIPTDGSPALISSVTLPADGSFVITATVQVTNLDQASDALVICELRHGVGFGGSVIDHGVVKLGPFIASGAGSAKVSLHAALTRTTAPTGVRPYVACFAAGGSVFAEWSNLTAVSVSSITAQ
jgi:hypothetical protein